MTLEHSQTRLMLSSESYFKAVSGKIANGDALGHVDSCLIDCSLWRAREVRQHY